MEITKALRDVGLTSNEIKVYLALLKLGSSKAGKVAKQAELNRTSTYDALQMLLQKGIISYAVRGKVKWFQPENPHRVKEFLEEQKENLNKVLPQLEALYQLPQEPRNVRLYKGLKGIKTVFQDIIYEGKPNDVFGSDGQFVNRLPYYAPHFVKQLEKKNIRVRNLVRMGRDVKPSKTTQVRYVSRDVKSPAVTNIYGEKIAIIMWTEVPEAVIIHNQAAAQAYRAYFEFMWKRAEKPKQRKSKP